MPNVLEQEYEFFHANLKEFSKIHLHEFVLIKGAKVINFFASYEKALREGLALFGNVPFFIEEVKEEEAIHPPYLHENRS